MDFDPALFAAATADSAARQDPPAPVASPLPAISLPAAPRPSLSPAGSRVFDRKQATDKPPRMNSGLDLSRPVSPRAAAPSNDSRSQSSGAANTDDARDTASIRQNILDLVHAGQAHPAAAGGTTSLAQMMGASGQKRTHRVNTGMTEQEREETERLEREMAATRAKWAAKNPPASSASNNNNSDAQGGPAGGGLSLASLLTGKTTNRAATAPAVMEPSHDNDAAEPAADSAPTEPARRFAASPEPTTATAAASPLPPPPTEQPQSSPRKPHDTLTRLQSSHIVSDRLRWSEQIQHRADEPQQQQQQQGATTATPPSPEKRRSVLERWGRDEPNANANVTGGGAAVPSSPTAVRTRPKSIFDAPPPSTQPSSEKPSKPDNMNDASDAAPKLQHVRPVQNAVFLSDFACSFLPPRPSFDHVLTLLSTLATGYSRPRSAD